MKKRILIVLLLGMCLTAWHTGYAQDGKTAGRLEVAMAGNSYVMEGMQGARITDKGITRWTDPETVISTYFHVGQAGKLKLSLKAKAIGTTSKIKVTVGRKSFTVTIPEGDFTVVPAGEIKVAAPGYVRVDMQGVSKGKSTFPEVSELIVDNVEGSANYVKNFSAYWGRRGPSVHMNYSLPKTPVEYFYNEVTVPEDGDVEASYYMANGFGEGYFGMQFNSPVERRVLFSVWSPFETQDPKAIPEGDRIRLLRQGEGVHIGEFGNEGSGGQSYLKYNWKAGKTYKFLMQVKPDGKGNTVYTAYFFATDENRWRLIASFLRPKTDTYYRHAHSFLENFSPVQGAYTRRVFFGNQWALDVNGEWHQVVDGRFTHDATANAGVRLDYKGGLTDDNKSFFLQNGGFFNDNTKAGTSFKRENAGVKPVIDFRQLEKL